MAIQDLDLVLHIYIIDLIFFDSDFEYRSIAVLDNQAIGWCSLKFHMRDL